MDSYWQHSFVVLSTAMFGYWQLCAVTGSYGCYGQLWGYGQLWVVVGSCGELWTKHFRGGTAMCGYGQLFPVMGSNGQLWVVMGSYGQNRFVVMGTAISGCEQLWTVLDGYGQLRAGISKRRPKKYIEFLASFVVLIRCGLSMAKSEFPTSWFLRGWKKRVICRSHSLWVGYGEFQVGHRTRVPLAGVFSFYCKHVFNWSCQHITFFE